MKLKIISLLLLVGQMLSGQFALKLDVDPCSRQYIYERLDRKYDRMLYADQYDEFLAHHLDTIDQQLKQYVTPDKSKLIKFEAVNCFDQYVHFNAPSPDGKRLLVTIYLKDTVQMITPADTFGKIDFKYDIVMNTGRNLHGSLPKSEATNYSKIEKIEIYHDGQSFEVSKNLFNDLVNPNTCGAYRSIRPMELFFDPAEEVFYLYIFGKIAGDYDPSINGHYRMASSFASKLVFNHKEVTGRILLDGFFLEKYGWADCLSFWPF